MSDRTNEWAAGIHALMFLRYNADAHEVLEMAWDTVDLDPEYLAEKKAVWTACPFSFFAHLDPERKARFIAHLRWKYEAEMIERYQLRDLHSAT